jgi:cyanophycinase
MVAILLFVSLLVPGTQAQTSGPKKGALIIQGGGDISLQRPEMWQQFIRLAGGPDANFVFIPTADEQVDPQNLSLDGFPIGKLKHVTVLHTRCRSEADTEAFVAPLRTANGVWFGAGRPFRLIDSYLYTLMQRELQSMLDRGGVIGGFSAGGMVMASYLMRGAILDDKILMVQGREEGLGYLKNVALDQRIDTRKRAAEMASVVAAHPGLLGLGLEESTAILVRGNGLEVIGPGRVAVTDGKEHEGKRYYYLGAGDQFDLKRRVKRLSTSVQIICRRAQIAKAYLPGCGS